MVGIGNGQNPFIFRISDLTILDSFLNHCAELFTCFAGFHVNLRISAFEPQRISQNKTAGKAFARRCKGAIGGIRRVKDDQNAQRSMVHGKPISIATPLRDEDHTVEEIADFDYSHYASSVLTLQFLAQQSEDAYRN
jgi:hypothetical protein